MTGPRRHQIKAFVSLVVLEKFRLLAEQNKRSINRQAEDLIENAVKDVELPEFPVRLAPKPVYVAPPPQQQTPEEIEADRQHKAQTAARYSPSGEYQKWRLKGNTPEKARSHVAQVCSNLGITWSGPTPEEESQIAGIIARRSQVNTVEEENGNESADL